MNRGLKRLLGLVLLLILIAGFLWSRQWHELPTSQDTTYPEIGELLKSQLNFEQLKNYFTNLAEKRGTQYAYEVLKRVKLPPNIDLHLLGHVVGDVLYRQHGAGGIKFCSEDFRNACSHTIVVGLLLDKGEGVLPEIAKVCRQAPGGPGAYTMCYHGLGHGILAYISFKLPEAIKLCQKIGTPEYGNQEAIQCIGGTIMEIISGGGHDRKLWARERTNYLKPNDPFYPCLASFMPTQARQMCLTYLTPYLWEAVGADLGRPKDEDFVASFKLCGKLSNLSNRNTCFGGFGKEFTTLAQNRDIRKIDQMTDEQFVKVYTWCKLAVDKQGIMACLDHALSSVFWGGENDRSASIRFCSIIPDSDNQSVCFLNLIGQVSSYIKDQNYRKSFCQEIPEAYFAECKNRLI